MHTINRIKYGILLLNTFIISSCNSQVKNDSVTPIVDTNLVDEETETENIQEIIGLDSTQLALNYTSSGSYATSKKKAKQLQAELRNRFRQLTDSTAKNDFLIDSVGSVFTHYLLNHIVPFWYGTTWAFEGHTNQPNDGEIACGYFVSTTLKHMNLNINRYQLARKSAADEAKTLAIDDTMLSKYTAHQIDSVLASMKEGLYFVGLDNHVGYILKKGEQIAFIHSDYIRGYVLIEDYRTSLAFGSRAYHIAKLSRNPFFLLYWLNNKEINIHSSRN